MCETDDTASPSTNKEVPQSQNNVTYCSLLQKNRPFRLFLSSYLITHAGQWFTYVASLTLIEELLRQESTPTSSSSSSQTHISILVVVRLLPNVFLSGLGGALADSRDRRESMILLDIIGALVALLYLVALWYRSIPLVYTVACLQECVTALYEPCRSAIVPLLAKSEGELQKAMTLAVLAWSLMAAVGSAAGGFFVASFGIFMCFVVDSVTYFASALLLWHVEGQYDVTAAAAAEEKTSHHPKEKEESFGLCLNIKSMMVEGTRYIFTSFFGELVFVKASAALLFGASDVLNVSFSQRDDDDNPKDASQRLGTLFAASGVGCIVGPLLYEFLSGKNKTRPSHLQLSCIGSLFSITLGYLGLGLLSPFAFTCLFSGIRAMGSAVLWVNSTLILQTFSVDTMMGRVMAVDYTLATLAEAFSALLCGFLQDYAELTATNVSWLMAALGVVVTAFWTAYHIRGYGVAGIADAQQVLQQLQEDASEIEAILPLVDEETNHERVHHRDTHAKDGGEEVGNQLSIIYD